VHDDQENIQMDKLQKLLKAVENKVERAKRKEAAAQTRKEACEAKLAEDDFCRECREDLEQCFLERYESERVQKWILAIVR
jgi:hypothetical protein